MNDMQQDTDLRFQFSEIEYIYVKALPWTPSFCNNRYEGYYSTCE